MLWVPIPSPDPVSITVTVIGAITSLFGLFRGKVSKNVQEALEGLRGSIFDIGQKLMRFGLRLARTLGWLLHVVHKIWVRVLDPMLDEISRIAERVTRVIDRVLRPYLEFMLRVRQAILDIYERYVRPVVVVIQRIRQVVAILRLARVPFARKLDDFLVRLQTRITAPILEALRRTTVFAPWINVLLTARMLLQQAILVNSAYAYQGHLVNLFWNAQQQGVDSGRQARQAAEAAPPTAEAAIRAGVSAALTGSGPLATAIEDAHGAARARFGV